MAGAEITNLVINPEGVDSQTLRKMYDIEGDPNFYIDVYLRGIDCVHVGTDAGDYNLPTDHKIIICPVNMTIKNVRSWTTDIIENRRTLIVIVNKEA